FMLHAFIFEQQIELIIRKISVNIHANMLTILNAENRFRRANHNMGLRRIKIVQQSVAVTIKKFVGTVAQNPVSGSFGYIQAVFGIHTPGKRRLFKIKYYTCIWFINSFYLETNFLIFE